MDRVAATLPQLTSEELANPHTAVTINGISVQLWQVAHLYNVNHGIPSPTSRSGASARDFRRAYPRHSDSRTTPLDGTANAAPCPSTHGRPFPDSPTLVPRETALRATQESAAGGGSKDRQKTENLLCLVDELVDEAWRDEESEQEAGCDTAESVGGPDGKVSNAVQGTLCGPSKPLPSLPIQRSSSNRSPSHDYGPTAATVPDNLASSGPTASTLLSRDHRADGSSHDQHSELPPPKPRQPTPQSQQGQDGATRISLPRTRDSALDTGASARRPSTPLAEDDATPRSHWSPDSPAERFRIKKVKKVLSFARLRPRRPKGAQPQTGNSDQANGSAPASASATAASRRPSRTTDG